MRALAVLGLAACGHGFFDPQPPDAAVSTGPPVMFVQSNFATSNIGQTTAISASFPVAIAADDVLVVVAAWNGASASIFDIGDNLGTAFSVAAGPTRVSGGWAQQIFVGRAPATAAAGTETVQVQMTGGTYLRLAIAAYRNLDGQNPIDTTGSETGGSSSVVQTALVTTTNPHDLLFVAGSSDLSLEGTLPMFTVRTQDGDAIVEDREVSQANGYQPTAPPGSNGNWIMQMVALRGL